MRILVKAATHRRCGRALTNIPIEMDKWSSTKKALSECRNSDFQISGFAISSHKNIQIIEVIAVTALVMGVINYVFFWNAALCGASGVVFAFILMASFTSFREGEIPITFILVAAIYLGQQVYDGVVLDDNISNMAHVVGGIVGGILEFSLNKRSKY